MPEYKVYTSQFDETIRAQDLISEKELDTLNNYMAQANPLADTPQGTTKFANTRQNASVTLLLDNSGSLRGQGILDVINFTSLAGQFFDHAGTPFEILGFTTKEWKGGQSRKKWLEAGRTQSPGRLNDLRHIIYKSFDDDWPDARRNLAIMHKKGLLKENIDGEALQWANQRSTEHGAARRIVIHVSDGAPIDDSTLSCNNSDILADHFNLVSLEIAQSAAELYNIGINYKVKKHHDSKLIVTPSQSPQMVFDNLMDKIIKDTPVTMHRGFPIPKRRLIV